jgi:hypothetical protein
MEHPGGIVEIQCECGKFRAQLTGFPRNSPGRLACYCDDCQTYLHHLGRADLLDPAGGTEVIPAYPSEVKFVQGAEFLKSTRLSPGGLDRWSTTCCNTPVANTRAGFPWAGFLHRVYTVADPGLLERTFGAIRSRIKGRFARGTPPRGTSSNIGFSDVLVVLPFLLRGKLLGKARRSPFFAADGVTPIVAPRVLGREERDSLRRQLGS